ncbi:uncharacterized protein LOC110228299 [Arabidopsis lyrata subsp. lyrata]|uniref:uncharacterized protein LOC110228299 n=1 Tax=Arabidopsis lyrata subsp. lyrata TaxID=81972 RepID=UPI000A29D4DB|nr:uncharacterized protein LOC110228299 [Arabidopsis lyrata subsp. lyrata]|eukprot:XP_020880792.1 uncharacterized protein LOC110228299 [Arabidopsis lyrata subsp. lyrata]
MSSPAVYVSENDDDSQGIPVPRGDEVFTQRGDKFGPHFRSQSTSASLGALCRLCNIPQEIEFSLPRPNESPKVVREGYCCAYKVYFKGCGNQTIPRPTVDFLSFFRIVSEGETNWNSFTLQRILEAGLAIKDGQTHPLDPPPEEKVVSSLNARDKRKMQAEIKALKDQLSKIGRKKRIAAISRSYHRVGNFHRKTLLVDDGSLEAALSAVVDTHGAEILNDPPVATAICPSEPGCEGEITSSPCTKRKAPDSDNLSNKRLKTVRLSSLPRVSSPLCSVSPSSEPLNSELPLPGDRVISEEIDEPRPEVPLSQGLSVRTQNPLPASISGGEEIGDIFRNFQTRERASLPPFSAFMETNGMIFHYENLLHQAKRETAKAKKEVDELRLANQSERLEWEKALESSFENMKKTLAANEQRIRIANAERDSARSNALRLEAELEENTAFFEEANQEIELLTRNRARDIAEAEHNAREEMRGFGRKLIQSVTKFIKDEEVWTKLLTDRAELKSNLDLIKELEAGRVSFENERGEVAAELAMVESELSSASRPTLDLKQFSLVFGDSPSQFEVGDGSRLHEGSPEV